MGFDDLNSPLVGNQQQHGASAPPSGSLYPQIVSPGKACSHTTTPVQ